MEPRVRACLRDLAEVLDVLDAAPDGPKVELALDNLRQSLAYLRSLVDHPARAS